MTLLRLEFKTDNEAKSKAIEYIVPKIKKLVDWNSIKQLFEQNLKLIKS